MARYYAAIITTLLLCGSCDLINGENTTATTDGIVINKSTGEPITGLSVVMKVAGGGGGFFGKLGGYRVVASGKTDQQGQFQLEADLGDLHIAQVYVNEEPYDPAFFTYNYSILAGEHQNKTVELYQTTILHARVEVSRALEKDDRYCLNLELIGVCEGSSQVAEITNTRAKGNAYNRVKVVGSIGGRSVERIDSVYCPNEEATEYTILIH